MKFIHVMVLYTVLGGVSKNTMVLVWFTDRKSVEEMLYFRPYDFGDVENVNGIAESGHKNGI